MKKIFAILLFLLIAVLLYSVSYGEDRFEYICKGADESTFYLDRSSITRTNSPNMLRGWYKNIVSDIVRQRYINGRKNNYQKQRMSQLSYIMVYFEINVAKNTYRIIEEDTYDFSGYFIDKGAPANIVWNDIPPNSVIGLVSKAAKQVVSQNTSNLEVTSVIVVLFLGGVTLSIIIVLSTDNISATHIDTNTSSVVNTQRVYEKTTSTEDKYKDDFDYPYEDIGKVTGL